MPEHIYRGKPTQTRFTLEEDARAKEIALSEKKAHPNYSWKKDLTIGYSTINRDRKSAKIRKKR